MRNLLCLCRIHRINLIIGSPFKNYIKFWRIELIDLKMKIKTILFCLAISTLAQITKAQTPNFVWAKSMGGNGAAVFGQAIAIDAFGNVYTTGIFQNTIDFDPGLSTNNLTSAGGDDIFISKLDASGNFVWAKSMGGTSSSWGLSIVNDPSGNVYTAGYFSGTVDFDPSATTYNLTSTGGQEIFIVKLNASGNFVWAKKMGGTSGDWGYSIDVDASGNVYSTGYFQGTADFDPGATSYNLTSSGLKDIFISKLDGAGNFMWAKSIGGTSNDYGYSIAIDASGNVFTTGYFQDTADFDPGAATYNLTTAGNEDIFISKLDASGNFIWAKKMGGTLTDQGSSLSFDIFSNVYITGYFQGTADFDPGAATHNLVSAGFNDIFISKLDASGNFEWAKRMGSNGNDNGWSIVYSQSNIYSSGIYQGTVDFDPGAGSYNLTSAGTLSMFISKLDTSGASCDISLTTNLTSPNCGSTNGSATVLINGGISPYNIQWSNGDFGLSADSLAPGQYVVQVTDANGCYSSLTVNLNPSNGPSVTSTSQNNVTCNGGSNGSVALNINGGSLPINILWSNGATTPTVSNLTAGVYDVVLTDASGCVVNASYNITEPDPIAVTFSTTPASCGSNNGSLAASVNGGTSPYNYQWSANASSQTAPTASNLGNGIYSLTVTDNANCTYSASGLVITSTSGPALSFSVTPSGGCGGSAQGSIDLTPSGGTTPYSYIWSNGATSQDLSNLGPGTYSVVVTGGNGCSSADTINIVNASGNTNPEICIVTVDSFTNTNKVIWEKPGSANGIKEYKIYREGSALNIYNLIKTLPFDSLSEYTDPVANPAVRAWRYKITYKDSCGVETVLSVNHKTIHLSVNVGISNTRNLAWDDYEGFPFLTFNIWRYHASTGWVKLDSLPSNLHSYTDLNPPGGGTLDYAIEVVKPNSCNSTRGIINTTRSNIRNIVAPPSGIGISEVSIGSYSLFPNPASQNFQMEIFMREKAQMTLKLYDVRGREIMQSQRILSSGKNTETFNISELESSVYFISVQVGEKIFRTKLVKEN